MAKPIANPTTQHPPTHRRGHNMQPTDPLFQPGPLTDIATQLSDMRKRQEHEFQPVQFFQLERLYQRAEQSATGVQQALANRLTQLIADYSHRLSQAQERFSQANEAPAEPAHTLHQYAQLQRLRQAEKQQPQIQKKAREQLRSLRSELSAPSLEELPVDSAQALDDEMLALEQAAQSDEQMELPLQAKGNHRQRQELKAVRRYRQLAAQQKTESMVNRAVIARPENPGPLNPHMLAIKSLTNMRDLSLPYLNRFVSYIETVMWLEEQLALDSNGDGGKNETGKTGKAGKKKSKAKPSK